MFKRKDVIITLWMTFLTVVAWIGFSIYHIWVTSTISAIDVSAISPINPNFDTGVINALKSRENVAPLYNLTENSASPTVSVGAKALPSSQPKEIIPQLSESP
jgi:hypothetical protein